MKEADWQRLMAVAGIVGVILFVIGIFAPLGAPPAPDDSIHKITKFYADHRDGVLASTYLQFLAVFLLLAWLTGLYAYLRRAEGGLGAISLLTFGGGLVGLGLGAVSVTAVATIAFKLAKLPGSGLEIRALYDVNTLLGALSGAFFVWLVFGAAIISFRMRAFPVWVAVLGVLLGLEGLIGPAFLGVTKGSLAEGGGVAGFIALLVFLLWVLITSVYMILRPSGPASTQPSAAMPGQESVAGP